MMLDLKRALYFKLNFILNVITNLMFVFMSILFWKVIYDNKYVIPGWDFKNLIMFTGFAELFFGIKNGFFATSSRFWVLIVTGRLDTLLVRPINPKLRVLIANTNIMEFVKGLAIFLSLLFLTQDNIHVGKLLIAVLMCFIAAINFALIEFCISYIAFKYGRVDAVMEIIDAMTLFNKYPLNMFPRSVFLFFVFVIPFSFLSTIPAMVGVGNMGWPMIGKFAIVLTIITVLWFAIDNYLWKKGLKKYESYNG